MAIENLSYLMFGVRDMDSWTAFAQDIVGLQLARRNADGSVGLRLDEHQQRILLVPDDLDDVLEAGWQFATETRLETFVQRLRAQGVEVV